MGLPDQRLAFIGYRYRRTQMVGVHAIARFALQNGHGVVLQVMILPGDFSLFVSFASELVVFVQVVILALWLLVFVV